MQDKYLVEDHLVQHMKPDAFATSKEYIEFTEKLIP